MAESNPQTVVDALAALDRWLPQLRCPKTGQSLSRTGMQLLSTDAQQRYSITKAGVAQFAREYCSPEGMIQQQHYDRVAQSYVANLDYPHSIEYGRHIDRLLFETIGRQPLGRIAEICCGRGEAIRLLQENLPGSMTGGIGVDVSTAMVEQAVNDRLGLSYLFVQGDATMLPIADASVDTVLMLGGIHHVNDRRRLFGEAWRILKPGGRLLWREPVNDFILWRWLRALIYKLSPALDEETEQPVRYAPMVSVLKETGFVMERWQTIGLFGFCLFMNSDVLVFNRLFRFVPGIRQIVRISARIDDLILKLPGLRHAGLQVVGAARKPN